MAGKTPEQVAAQRARIRESIINRRLTILAKYGRARGAAKLAQLEKHEAAVNYDPANPDTSFDFGENVAAEEAPADLEKFAAAERFVESYKNPEKREIAKKFIAYARGETNKRPEGMTAEMEKEIAAETGVADPEGFKFDERGLSLKKGIGSRKKTQEMPEALREWKERNNPQYDLPGHMKQVETGKRGGRFYINRSGTKVYIKG